MYLMGMVGGYNNYDLDSPVYLFERPYTRLRTSDCTNTDLLACSRDRWRSMSMSWTPSRWT